MKSLSSNICWSKLLNAMNSSIMWRKFTSVDFAVAIKIAKKSWGVGESSPYDICRIHRFEITLLSVDS